MAAGEAQSQQLKFTSLTIQDGLSQASINGIAQDSTGFLWIGTQNGLNRYDGKAFRATWAGSGGVSPVSYGWIRTVFVDHGGRVWASVASHGLFAFDPSQETFAPVTVQGRSGEGSADVTVWDFADGGDTVVVATSAGVALIRWLGNGPSLVLPQSGPVEGCAAETTAVWRDHAGVLWAGTSDGCVARGVDASGRRAVPALGRAPGLVRDLRDGPDGSMAVATDPAGLFTVTHSGLLVGRGENARPEST